MYTYVADVVVMAVVRENAVKSHFIPRVLSANASVSKSMVGSTEK